MAGDFFAFVTEADRNWQLTRDFLEELKIKPAPDQLLGFFQGKGYKDITKEQCGDILEFLGNEPWILATVEGMIKGETAKSY